VGRDDPYRLRPWFIGAAPMSEVNNNWVLYVRCRSCGRDRKLGRIRDVPQASDCSTQGEFVARLTCSKCGSRYPLITVEFAGKRRD